MHPDDKTSVLQVRLWSAVSVDVKRLSVEYQGETDVTTAASIALRGQD
jgi:hypothetical protein